MTIVKDVMVQGRRLELAGHWEDSPVFSILKGSNGSGKSTALRRLVEAASPGSANAEAVRIWRSPGSPLEGVAARDALVEAPLYALSGSTSDRFPLARSGLTPTEYYRHNYHYLGQRVGGSLSRRVAVEGVVRSLSIGGQFSEFGELRRAFGLVGLEPFVLLEIAKRSGKTSDGELSAVRGRPFSLATLDAARLRGGSEASARQRAESRQASFLLEAFGPETFASLDDFLQQRHRAILTLDLNGVVQSNGTGLTLGALTVGLDLGQLVLHDVKLKRIGRQALFPYLELSSGEFQMLHGVAGALASACRGSIFLIDEPETSLHPSWQMAYMQMLWDIRRKVPGASHTVIATHSPVIVSNAPVGAFVIDSDSYEFGLSNSFGSPVDEILHDQFGLVSGRNYRLLEVLQSLIAHRVGEDVISNPRRVSELRRELRALQSRLSDRDPINDLISELLLDDAD